MEINKLKIIGGHQQFADKISNKYSREKNKINDSFENKINARIIKDVIIKGNIQKAITLILELDISLEIEEDIILIGSQLSRLENDMVKNIVSYEEGMRIRTKITLAILKLINQV